MRIKKLKKHSKRNERSLPLADIEKINTAFLDELERVKTRLGYVKDPSLINSFYDVLLNAYNAAIEVKTLEREVDYDIKLAEIKARETEQTPWRRGWWWRLIFRPLTNRAQDIIEERAELEADSIHTVAENLNKNARNLLQQNDGKKLSKRQLKRKTQDKLKAVIKEADKSDLNEAFTDPQSVPTEQAKTDTADVMHDVAPAQEQPKEQMRLDELPFTQTRRPRPPRSCRQP